MIGDESEEFHVPNFVWISSGECFSNANPSIGIGYLEHQYCPNVPITQTSILRTGKYLCILKTYQRRFFFNNLQNIPSSHVWIWHSRFFHAGEFRFDDTLTSN